MSGSGWPRPIRSGGRSFGSICVPSHISTARSIALSSWRTLPFHWAAISRRIVSLEALVTRLPICRLCLAMKWSTSSGTSSIRSRKWRDANLDAVEAIEEVFLEGPFADEADELLAGGGDDAGGDLVRSRAAGGSRFLELDRAEEPRLGAHREMRDLIEEDGAVARHAESARNLPESLPNSSLSRSSLGRVAQFTAMNFSSFLGPARWIARAKSSLPVPVSPTRSTLECVTAILAIDGLQFLERLAGADDELEPLRLRQLLPEPLVLEEHVAKLVDAAELVGDVLEHHRLDEVVERAGLESVDGVFDRRIGRDDQDEDGRIDLLQLPEELDAVAVGEADVADGDLEVLLAGLREGLGTVAGLGDDEALFGEELPQAAADDLFVFNDEYGALVGHERTIDGRWDWFSDLRFSSCNLQFAINPRRMSVLTL